MHDKPARSAPGRQRKRLVVSAVNLVEGGTLTVLRECLPAARDTLGDDWEIIALVHDPALVGVPGIEYRAFPAVKQSWLRRLWFEYWQCRRLSMELDADLWLALHDITPVVTARRQAVYCHNPMPFYRMSAAEVRLAPKLLLFALFYGWMYRLNVKRNHAVVVQQEWLRSAFMRRFGARRTIVARPVALDGVGAATPRKSGRVFVYPTFPRVFKNIELIGEAVRWLERRAEGWQGEARLTLRGDENAYAAHLRARFGDLASLKFVGPQTREGMERQYEDADCLLFPSRLETWGLPLTEAKAHGLAIIAADLPYAHESVGTYGSACFVDPADPEALARTMLAFQRGELHFEPRTAPPVAEPYAPDWPGLMRLLVAGL